MDMDTPSFFSFFTKYSYLDNYGFTAGFFGRIFRKFLPKIAHQESFEYYLQTLEGVDAKREGALVLVSELLNDSNLRGQLIEELDRSIEALVLKIASFGLDHEISSKYDQLAIDTDCYRTLSRIIADVKNHRTENLQLALSEVKETIEKLRKYKNQIGTSMHLTVLTVRVLEHLKRVTDLIDLRGEITSSDKWEQIITQYLDHDRSRNSLRKYIGSHLDLLALEIVEHTSYQGERYIARNFQEYIGFFRKGLMGGAIISVFALFKIFIDNNNLSDLPLALAYSCNYALCFLIVKYLGGVIATKQPAMTASTIIKHIDKNNDLKIDAIQDIILLIRKVFRSQFASLMGNFLMALIMSSCLAFLLNATVVKTPISGEKASYLFKQVSPIYGGGIFYASIAGVFLALSGLISGYFDNKVIASNLTERVQRNMFLSKHISEQKRIIASLFIKKNLGIITGNVSLGFLLGSSFLFSNVFPFDIDIRHIAFSSANVGYALVNQPFSLLSTLYAFLGVMTIGLVNFLVSFSITFFLALKSRSITLSGLKKLIKLSLKDIMFNPLAYLAFNADRTETKTK